MKFVGKTNNGIFLLRLSFFLFFFKAIATHYLLLFTTFIIYLFQEFDISTERRHAIKLISKSLGSIPGAMHVKWGAQPLTTFLVPLFQ